MRVTPRRVRALLALGKQRRACTVYGAGPSCDVGRRELPATAVLTELVAVLAKLAMIAACVDGITLQLAPGLTELLLVFASAAVAAELVAVGDDLAAISAKLVTILPDLPMISAQLASASVNRLCRQCLGGGDGDNCGDLDHFSLLTGFNQGDDTVCNSLS